MAPTGTVHVVGAGLAGLAAALALSEGGTRPVVLHEAARHAGGRCRSYFDTQLGRVIDNGNHLVLSGNGAVRAHLRTIGAEGKVVAPDDASFHFADLRSGERWTVRPNAGPLPWWIFSKARRVPGTGWADYLGLGKLMRARADAPIASVMRCAGPLYERLWHPLLVAALNTEPKVSAAGLAGQVIRETLAKGGAACRPLIAAEGLAEAFVDPALATLAARDVPVHFDHRLRRLEREGNRAVALDFGEERVELKPDDAVVLAVTAPVASLLMPDITAPDAFRSIANIHFLVEAPPGMPDMLGLINSTAEWLFRFPGRMAVTVSDADRLLDMPREELARMIWAEVVAATGLPADPMPPWQVIREKRATFAALPEQDKRRPGPVTPLRNVVLAGDWTQTGLPATIEGALRSGHTAVKALLAA